MSEMVERVARKVDGHLRDVLAPGDLIWSKPGGPSNLALNIARAVIEAMTEPTMAMWDHGEMAVFESQRAERKYLDEIKARTGGLPGHMSAHSTAAWKAMIAEALK